MSVTNILGLRAFTSQLLCEQVIGRGLRRVSYELNENKMFDPEYVTVFGIPFSLFWIIACILMQFVGILFFLFIDKEES